MLEAGGARKLGGKSRGSDLRAPRLSALISRILKLVLTPTPSQLFKQKAINLNRNASHHMSAPTANPPPDRVQEGPEASTSSPWPPLLAAIGTLGACGTAAYHLGYRHNWGDVTGSLEQQPYRPQSVSDPRQHIQVRVANSMIEPPSPFLSTFHHLPNATLLQSFSIPLI
jgi:hypothetical protein